MDRAIRERLVGEMPKSPSSRRPGIARPAATARPLPCGRPATAPCPPGDRRRTAPREPGSAGWPPGGRARRACNARRAQGGLRQQKAREGGINAACRIAQPTVHIQTTQHTTPSTKSNGGVTAPDTLPKQGALRLLWPFVLLPSRPPTRAPLGVGARRRVAKGV